MNSVRFFLEPTILPITLLARGLQQVLKNPEILCTNTIKVITICTWLMEGAGSSMPLAGVEGDEAP